MLAFERAHPERTLRLRYEELDADPTETARLISAFIGMPETPGRLPLTEPQHSRPADGTMVAPHPAAVGCGAHVPVGRIPIHLLYKVNGLLAQLGYESLAYDAADGRTA